MPDARQWRSFLYGADCSAPVVRESCDTRTLSSLPGSYAGPDRPVATIARRATSCLALLLVGFA